MIFSRKNKKAKGCKYLTNDMLSKIHIVYKNEQVIIQVYGDDLNETLEIIDALEKERKRKRTK